MAIDHPCCRNKDDLYLYPVNRNLLYRLFGCAAIICLCNFANAQKRSNVYVKILGVAQDGGYPHAGCTKACCAVAFNNNAENKFVVSFALVDSVEKEWWLFEATPDIKFQLEAFRKSTFGQYSLLPQGIFLTHAHIGHYTGLMQFGKEVMSTKDLPVYVLPRFKRFLEENGPWSQLVSLRNIVLRELNEDSMLALSPGISIAVFKVPHRDEYSETAGFKIITAEKKYLFIPDIDKWSKWNQNLVEQVKLVDVALLDATFYSQTELPGRAIADVPHPLVTETMELFSNEKSSVKSKIYFIHFNHSNPLLWDAEKIEEVKSAGFRIAFQMEDL